MTGRPRPAATSRASDRLRRLLVLVPYLVKHPGTELSEITRLFGVRDDELTSDLNLLFVSGLPPYGPGDLIGVAIEDGRVWIDMAASTRSASSPSVSGPSRSSSFCRAEARAVASRRPGVTARAVPRRYSASASARVRRSGRAK
jgi:predicted DNA-binding transcriptional regulator YafY